MTEQERELARARVREWPVEERRALTRMTEPEVQAIALLTALLDLRPVEERGTPGGEVP